MRVLVCAAFVELFELVARRALRFGLDVDAVSQRAAACCAFDAYRKCTLFCLNLCLFVVLRH